MPAPAPPSDLSTLSLAQIAQLVADRKLAPVDSWNPARCGDSAMRIARDGTWYHEGAPINRPAMVRLFAGILRREPDGGYVLVTPAEKLDIAVEDAPFVAVEVKVAGEGPDTTLAFRLNTGDVVIADADHPLHFVDRADGPHPYLTVRTGLDALIARPVYYELAVIATADDDAPPGLWSAGCFFPMTPAA
ncbi:DUF1285 domain-containing protein [Sphingomonas prati]|uniref:DUF1285 domain-containing protein n=1 Tax=Sphingomonas prati TaxID=1843237 RepID=A0A7W9BQR3_9SPHN|nr:DUF1285 domain-containing protein [Sphingomonas prati]MBB5727898.1 hypothetical protein [Sphingomonas prati]GGE81683.1 hypothetical protein GCM10011404_12910 [Sphingomonas prati]